MILGMKLPGVTSDRVILGAVLTAIFWLLMSTASSSSSRVVDLELVLAVDSSASVDFAEFNSQIRGLAEAWRNPDLADLIAAGPTGRVAVTVMEWSSDGAQTVVIPWTEIASAADANNLADEIDNLVRHIAGGATSIAAALEFAIDLFADNHFDGFRQVIDVSGDGYNNTGGDLAAIRRHPGAAGITINGLAIENDLQNLSDYYRKHVIVGPAAFVETATDYRSYMLAIKRKLLREIGDVPLS